MEMQNLWPDFTIEAAKSHRAILKEQAGYLMAKTNNVLSAEVDTTPYEGGILHKFFIVAPALNNYRYKLFSVTHRIIDYYPLEITTEISLWNESYQDYETFDVPKDAKNEEEFLETLSIVFKNPDNVRVISSLLSQSLAD